MTSGSDDKWRCPSCECNLSYSDKWDAKYCRVCNEWRDKKCSEININDYESNIIECYFECWNRPEKPIREGSK